jgi:hypothetical protein
MRKIILLQVAVLLASQLLSAKDTLPPELKVYKTVVHTPDAGKPIVGFLASVSDTAAYVMRHSIPLKASEPVGGKVKKIDYPAIRRIRVWRKGSNGRAMLLGGVVGIVAGAISGFVKGDDPPCTRPAPDLNDIFGFSQFSYGLCNATRRTGAEKAGGNAIVGGLGGALAGLIIGSVAHKTFIIGGRTEKLREMKAKLLP